MRRKSIDPNISMEKVNVHYGYCSWCFKKTSHHLIKTHRFRRNIYCCGSCNCQGLVCRAPGCNDMTRRGVKLDAQLCAVHAGRIAGFKYLNFRIDKLEDYPRLFEREGVNLKQAAKKAGTTAAFFIGGATITGPLAFTARSAVGNAIDSTIFRLTGADAIRKGLAKLGLGAMNAGGYGMGRGAAVITAVGAATGGVMSGVIANAYFGDIESFGIRCLKEGKGPAVVVINGFLTQDKLAPERDWIDALSKHYPTSPWYIVEWESKRLLDLGRIALVGGGKVILTKALREAFRRMSKQAAKKISPTLVVFNILSLASNSWHVAMVKAVQTGFLLADIIARTPPEQEYILLGHSLGARVIYYVLRSLAGKEPRRIITVHLLGGAVGRSPAKDWKTAASAVSREIHNYFSLNDRVLQILYTGGRFLIGSPAIGRHPINAHGTNIKNHNVSQYVDGHGSFKRTAVRYLEV